MRDDKVIIDDFYKTIREAAESIGWDPGEADEEADEDTEEQKGT